MPIRIMKYAKMISPPLEGRVAREACRVRWHIRYVDDNRYVLTPHPSACGCHETVHWTVSPLKGRARERYLMAGVIARSHPCNLRCSTLQGQEPNEKPHISFGEKHAAFWMTLLLILSDYFAVLFAEEAAYLIRSNIRTLYAGGYLYLPPLYFFLFVPTIFLSFLYSRRTHLQNVPFWSMARGVFHAVLYSMLTIIMLMFFGKVADVVSRLYVGFVGVFAFVFILTFRYLLKKNLERMETLSGPHPHHRGRQDGGTPAPRLRPGHGFWLQSPRIYRRSSRLRASGE